MPQHRGCAGVFKVTLLPLTPPKNILFSEEFLKAMNFRHFFRTFPAAIAGRGDYFHYDIDTKEAVSF